MIVLEPTCFRCKRMADAISEYVEAVRGSTMTPAEYVRREEGTYNPENGHFACTECYIAIGQPTAPWPGWKAP